MPVATRGVTGLTARYRRAGAALLVALLSALVWSPSAFAETKTFAKQGCEKWEVPAGVSSVAIQATGAAGEGGAGGRGDSFSAVLSGLSPGEDLFVCVDEGGGAS